MTDDIVIRVGDIQAAGYCVAGARDWFALHGLNWRAFVRNGASSSELLATGDALAERVVACTRSRQHG